VEKILVGKILVEEIRLENGLTLELYDKSRPVAGDRWMVTFEACIDIEVKTEYLEDMPAGVSLEQIRSALGDRVTYSYEKVSIFVAETDKDAIFNKLKKDFLETNVDYLSEKSFGPRFVMKKYHEPQGLATAWKLQ
jgi:hypothetical protein